MLRSLLLLVCLMPVIAAEAQVIDLPVRYINRDMITYQDLKERAQLNLVRRKRQPPRTLEENEQLLNETLEELTEESLILQEADRLGVAIPEDRIYQEVRQRLAQEQQVPDPKVLSELVKQRTRTLKMQFVIQHYLRMAPPVRPLDIEAYYKEHRDSFSRPARWHLYQIMVMPASRAEIKNAYNNLTAIYRGILDSPEAEIKALINDQVTQEFLALKAGSIEQIRFLADICDQLLALEVEDPGPVTRNLLESARRWSTAARALRDKEAVTALMQKLSDELLALEPEQRLTRFQELANTYSVGLGAGQGGDLGLVELESQHQAYQEQIQKLDDHSLSPVFWSGRAAVLLYVSHREEAVQRSFTEVNGEIRKILEGQQHIDVRDDLISQLRDQAHIVNVE